MDALDIHDLPTYQIVQKSPALRLVAARRVLFNIHSLETPLFSHRYRDVPGPSGYLLTITPFSACIFRVP